MSRHPKEYDLLLLLGLAYVSHSVHHWPRRCVPLGFGLYYRGTSSKDTQENDLSMRICAPEPEFHEAVCLCAQMMDEERVSSIGNVLCSQCNCNALSCQQYTVPSTIKMPVILCQLFSMTQKQHVSLVPRNLVRCWAYYTFWLDDWSCDCGPPIQTDVVYM